MCQSSVVDNIAGFAACVHIVSAILSGLVLFCVIIIIIIIIIIVLLLYNDLIRCFYTMPSLMTFRTSSYFSCFYPVDFNPRALYSRGYK